MPISRRNALVGLGGALVMPIAAAESLRPTPQETLGPYYPVHLQATHDFDLTRVPHRPGRATGQVIELSGRVLRVDGAPIPGATIELWQANASGRYSNAVDKNPAPLDPNFIGVALLRVGVHCASRGCTIAQTGVQSCQPESNTTAGEPLPMQ